MKTDPAESTGGHDSARWSEAQESELRNALECLAVFASDLRCGRLLIQKAASPANPSQSSIKVVEFRSSNRPSPLETLNTLGQRLETLILRNVDLANELQPISDELTELRHDIASLFHELRSGNIAAASAYAAQNVAVEIKDEIVNARLKVLEDKDHEPPTHTAPIPSSPMT